MEQIAELLRLHREGLITNRDFWRRMLELSGNKYANATEKWDEDAND